MGITARRRYGFARGRLTGFEDEPLARADLPTGGAAAHSEILEAEIGARAPGRCATSSPRSSPSRTS